MRYNKELCVWGLGAFVGWVFIMWYDKELWVWGLGAFVGLMVIAKMVYQSIDEERELMKCYHVGERYKDDWTGESFEIRKLDHEQLTVGYMKYNNKGQIVGSHVMSVVAFHKKMSHCKLSGDE